MAPVVGMLLVAPGALGSYDAENSGTAVGSEASRSSYTELPDEDPVPLALLDYAARVWARDAWSAEALAGACDPAKVELGADLAHLPLRAARRPGPPEENVTGYVLNFEDPHPFRREALCAFIESQPPDHVQRWLVQEVRTLSGSEMELWSTLPGGCRQLLDLRKPDYATAGSVSPAASHAWARIRSAVRYAARASSRSGPHQSAYGSSENASAR